MPLKRGPCKRYSVTRPVWITSGIQVPDDLLTCSAELGKEEERTNKSSLLPSLPPCTPCCSLLPPPTPRCVAAAGGFAAAAGRGPSHRAGCLRGVRGGCLVYLEVVRSRAGRPAEVRTGSSPLSRYLTAPGPIEGPRKPKIAQNRPLQFFRSVGSMGVFIPQHPRPENHHITNFGPQGPLRPQGPQISEVMFFPMSGPRNSSLH